MSDHPINSVMNSAMENLKQMVEVDTIIGDAITSPDGTVIIPVSKVSFGLAAGGGEYCDIYNITEEEFVLISPVYSPIQYDISYYYDGKLIESLSDGYTIETEEFDVL